MHITRKNKQTKIRNKDYGTRVRWMLDSGFNIHEGYNCRLFRSLSSAIGVNATNLLLVLRIVCFWRMEFPRTQTRLSKFKWSVVNEIWSSHLY